MSRRRSVATKPPQHVPHRPAPRRTDSAPHSSEMPRALAHFQRLANDSGPVQRLRSLQQSASEGGPIQRVLGYNQAIAKADVANVSKLAHKVWLLEGPQVQGNAPSVVIKLELRVSQGEAMTDFRAREGITREMGAMVLDGVPGANPASANDLAVIGTLDNANCLNVQAQNELAELKAELNGQNAAQTVVIKVAKVANIPKSVGDQIFEAKQQMQANLSKGGKVKSVGNTAAGVNAVARNILQLPVATSLGKMAAFDLIVGNFDRFSHDGTINIQNLEVFGNQALGLDNLNPYGAIRGIDPGNQGAGVVTLPWPGGSIVTDTSKINVYAKRIQGDILKSVDLFGAVADELGPTGLATWQITFINGLIAAIRTLKHHETSLRQRLVQQAGSAEDRQAWTIMADRLAQIPKM
ncbi:hypothetical protein [Yoonia sediminilitoris]|uniref:Uncharacterized protein n=1 Tax=Yoonia sediminilitoris TaxID=1286148 RepID=A0A2T6KGZ1_9RHOB|nr:hypothetical protein [Yoonia sediminilitoris]PUB14783.1 hypothetical protein C8N45_1054 [Yoonia sediminilitoris]RCW95500.1 hypothetical protein DFP92_1054 [Yoonia sediminilitoris]